MFKQPKRLAAGLLAGSMMTSLAYAGNASPPTYVPDLLPPNPQSGECYARVTLPGRRDIKSQTVLVKDGFTEIDISEPQLRSRQEQFLVKEASVRYEVRQPTYQSITEQVMVRPAYDKLKVTRPVFSTVQETVSLTKPRLVWKRGNPAALRAKGYRIHSTADGRVRGPGYRGPANHNAAQPQLCGPSCEVWCLVEEPGESVTYTRKVLTQDSSVQRIPVPAKYTRLTKQVVADPGGVREIAIPAEYTTLMIEELTGSGGVRDINRPPVYGSVGRRVETESARHEWRRIVCNPGTHPADRRTHAAQGVSSSGSATSVYQYESAPSGRIYSGPSASNMRSYSGSSSTHAQMSSARSTFAPLVAPLSSSSSLRHASRTYGSVTNRPNISAPQAVNYKARTKPTAVSIGSETHYVGSDLPTYSEDYTKPPMNAQPIVRAQKSTTAREKRRYR